MVDLARMVSTITPVTAHWGLLEITVKQVVYVLLLLNLSLYHNELNHG